MWPQLNTSRCAQSTLDGKTHVCRSQCILCVLRDTHGLTSESEELGNAQQDTCGGIEARAHRLMPNCTTHVMKGSRNGTRAPHMRPVRWWVLVPAMGSHSLPTDGMMGQNITSRRCKIPPPLAPPPTSVLAGSAVIAAIWMKKKIALQVLVGCGVEKSGQQRIFLSTMAHRTPPLVCAAQKSPH